MIREKCPNAIAIGIHTPHQWTGQPSYEEGSVKVEIVECCSPLAIRIVLQAPQHPDVMTVILTPCEETDLDEDILLRLAKRRLFPISPWQSVKEQFGAQFLDPRLQAYPWLADYLLNDLSRRNYRVPAGVLDAETVWSIVLERELNIQEERPDLQSLLEWSLDSDAIARYQHSNPDIKTVIKNRFMETAGLAAEWLFTYLEQNESANPIAMGIVLDILCQPAGQGQLDRAIGKLEERYFGGQTFDANQLKPWPAATAQVIKARSPFWASVQAVADEYLQELGAIDFAHLSDLSQTGFEQRLQHWSTHLEARLKPNASTGTTTNLTDLRQAFQLLLTSHAYEPDSRLAIALNMAMRLGQWLEQNAPEPLPTFNTFDEAVQHEIRLGLWLDRARFALVGASDSPHLSKTFTALFQTITTYREQLSQQFAEHLVQATAQNDPGKIVIPVEKIVSAIVAPIAAKTPVLLIVMDGMSLSIAQNLVEGLTTKGWHLWQTQANSGAIAIGLATIPSDTKTSRNSLFSGNLSQGNAAQEVKAFAQHPDLTQRRRGRKSPILFHKANLRDAAQVNLSAEVYTAIQDKKQTTIGVVVNAIDDQLDKGEQTTLPQTVKSIPVLEALLHAARDHDRVVILTSDHGHVLDHAAHYEAATGGERWRTGKGSVKTYEYQISGDRVLGTPEHTLIAPWTETYRYTKKKQGYHGGINPQEMLVAIAILCPTVRIQAPDGFQLVTHLVKPDWWQLGQ